MAAQEVTDELADRDLAHSLGAEGMHRGHCRDVIREEKR
jgi:hypothetical protein